MAADYTLFIQDAQRVSEQSGVPASIVLGQIILESSGKYQNGLSGLAANHKNLFGVKGKGSAGSVSMPTKEVVNGQFITVNQNFRAYNSYYDSILDHAKLLNNPRYTKHTSVANNLTEYAKGIAKGGYATDPKYADKLMNVINKYGLQKYDNGKVTGGAHHLPHDGAAPNNSTAITDTAAGDDEKTFATGLFFNVTKVIAIAGLLILMVVFFLRAFPVAETAVQALPVGKAVKSVKKIAKKGK